MRLYEITTEDKMTLPMDTQSRMKRAKALGFNKKAFHATSNMFDAFSVHPEGHSGNGLGIHVGTSDQAESIIKASRVEKKHLGIDFRTNGNVMPLLIRGNKWLRLPDLGKENAWDVHHILTALYWNVKETEKEYPDGIVVNLKDKFNPTLDDIRDTLIEHGYDGIVYKNEFEGDRQTDSYIVFDPSNIRSIFATFDPNKSSSSNLLETFLYPIGSKMPSNIIDYRDPNKAEEKFMPYDEKQLAWINSDEYQNKFGRNKEIPVGYQHKVPDTKIVLGHNNEVIVFFYGDNNIIPWKELISIINKEVDTNLQTDTLFGIEVKDNGYVIAQSRDTGQWTGDRTKYSLDLKHTVQVMIDRGIANDKTSIWIGTYKNPTLVGTAGNIVKTPDIPSKLIVYHGTSSYRWHHIQKTGLKALPVEERVWNKGALEKERSEHREDSVYLTASMDQATYYAKKAVNVDRKRYGPQKRQDASSLTKRLEQAIRTTQYDLEQVIKNPDELVKDQFNYYLPGQKRFPAKHYEEMIAKWKEQIEKLVPMKDYYGDMKPVILEITLGKSDYKNLMADDDYLAKKYSDMNERNQHSKDWRDSLSHFGQIAFKGTIPPSRIKAQ